MVKVIEVKTKKERKEFVEFPLRLYKGNPYFVPPLYMDEMALFTDKNIYNKTCKSAFFLAVKDGKTVGRIQAIIQYQYNDIHNTKQVRFTRFDSLDDVEIATALFTAVENFAKANGMEEVVGPLGYSDLEREGLLIEGFDYLSTFEEQYNYPYYASLIEANGYQKDVDWVESRLFKSKQQDERLQKFAQRALERYHLHIGGENLGKAKFIKRYAKGIFDCIDECYKDLYGVVPFTPEMMKQMIDQFMLIVNRRYVVAICDENETVVAFGLCLPGIGPAVQKSGGRLTLPCLIRLLRAAKKPKSIDLALVGILPKYRKSGLSAYIMTKLNEMLNEPHVEYCETNLNLETNNNIQTQWKNFDHIQHKRRRAYKKKV
ncbi:MAG: hypothetical protein IJ996_05375 [Clostridia bacterium]|nr:hypothetical protein [Clostridia bacterium]